MSNEISFSTSLTEKNDIEARIATMAHKVGRRLRQKQIEGTTLHLKIRREDLTIRTCQRNPKHRDKRTYLAAKPLRYA